MGLLQKAIETYDAHSALIGVAEEGKEMLAPISHWMASARIEISLDRDGNFIEAHLLGKDEPKIPIPITESSEGRQGTKALEVPHPLCDQLKYLAPCFEKPYQAYISQLESWASSQFSHPKLAPILAYEKSGSILKDLSAAGIIKLKADGTPKKENLLVRWRVYLDGAAGSGACWTDKSLFSAYIDWYRHEQASGKKDFCMISGQTGPTAENNPKGIVPLYGNAKLISSKDSNGFKYRGRFSDKRQALTVGYEASQKAHNALRWLVANQGKYYGGRLFLCWNPHGIVIPNPAAAFLPFDTAPIIEMSDYRDKLASTLLNTKKTAHLSGKDDEATAVLAVFDAPSKKSGRLSLTDYNEFMLADYLQRLYQWELDFCWENGAFGLQSPSLPRLVNNAFGSQRKEHDNFIMKTDDKVFCQQLQRLIHCRLSSAQRLSKDIVRRLVNRASTPQAYDRIIWLNILFTACAAVRKYRYDYDKEEWNVTLDERQTNPSYLFGRLLAIAEKVERDTYDEGEKREPNAIRMQTVFSRRPLRTWRILEEKLNPYYLSLKPAARKYYRDMIGQIVTVLEQSSEDLTKPLEDVYLLGYYSQRKALYTKKSEQKVEE